MYRTESLGSCALLKFKCICTLPYSPPSFPTIYLLDLWPAIIKEYFVHWSCGTLERIACLKMMFKNLRFYREKGWVTNGLLTWSAGESVLVIFLTFQNLWPSVLQNEKLVNYLAPYFYSRATSIPHHIQNHAAKQSMHLLRQKWAKFLRSAVILLPEN